MKKMLVLYTLVDRVAVIKGVCQLNRRGLAEEWQRVDKHRFIEEVEILS